MVARRSYGSGPLQIRSDHNGRESYYGSWRVGGRRVNRLGVKRTPSCADGLTRVQAEAALRRLMAATLAPPGERYTVAEAAAIYIEHLEFVMERKRSTIADYRGYLGRHLGPFFGGRTMDRIDRVRVEEFLLTKKRSGLSYKTIGNHLTFLHGLWSFGVKREWVGRNVVALVDRPRAPRFKDRRIKFLSREEREALLRAVPSDYLGEVDGRCIGARR